MTTSLAIVPTPQGAEQDSASTQDNIGPRFLKKEALDLYIANTADTFAYEMQLLRKYNGVYYLYNGIVYQPLDEASFYHMAYHYALSENIRLKPSDCSQLLESVKIRTAESYISPDREDYTVFRNCLVSNSNGVPMQVIPCDYFATIYVDANYLMDANLSHPTADAFLATISGNDPELITRHWEFWGYVLSSDYHAKAIFSLFGPTGNNGKSTELSLLSAFLPGAVDSMAIKYMTSRFGRHRLQHRRFEYSADEGAVNLDSESIGFLKSASGGDNMTADVKCKEMVRFICKCKIAIASNYNIGMAYTAVEQAFVRRLVTLPYPYSIPKECQDPMILQNLLMEKDAIATEAFRHYLRLKANNYRFTGHERFDQIQSIQCSPATAEYDAIRDFSQKYCDFTDSSAFVTTQELFRKLNMSVPAELISTMPVTDNLEVMTCQKFTKKCNHYNGKNILLFLDECHCLAEDAAFSTYPQQVVEFLRRNLDKTTRIYITATPEAVLPTIWKLESTSSDTKPLYPLTVDNLDDFLWFTPIKDDTRLQMVYLMQADWSYLTFQTYHPDEVEALADYLKAAAQDGKKSLIYINDIQKGGELQTLLEGSQHIYSDEDKRAELTEITQNASFASTALITTKVAENGISLHDDSLAIIVAETFDPIVLQQVIGRARVKRKKPREIVVLIPDYTASHLGSIMNKVYSARIEFDRASESPDFTMQYMPQPTPYIYYDAIAQKPTLNELGRKELQRQLDFLQQMRDEESDQPHAFVRYVLNLYGKDTTQIESLSIHYSKLSDCHTRICTAWETFKESNMGADALATLKAALKAACNETGAYPKELKSNIQVDTVNDILRFAGIREKVLPESKVYKITAITD